MPYFYNFILNNPKWLKCTSLIILNNLLIFSILYSIKVHMLSFLRIIKYLCRVLYMKFPRPLKKMNAMMLLHTNIKLKNQFTKVVTVQGSCASRIIVLVTEKDSNVVLHVVVKVAKIRSLSQRESCIL